MLIMSLEEPEYVRSSKIFSLVLLEIFEYTGYLFTSSHYTRRARILPAPGGSIFLHNCRHGLCLQPEKRCLDASSPCAVRPNAVSNFDTSTPLDVHLRVFRCGTLCAGDRDLFSPPGTSFSQAFVKPSNGHSTKMPMGMRLE